MQTSEKIKITIYTTGDKIGIICNKILVYNKKGIGSYISDFGTCNNNYIKGIIMGFIENNMYGMDENYLFTELEKYIAEGRNTNLSLRSRNKINRIIKLQVIKGITNQGE